MPSPYLAHADAQGRLCGLPPCCVLSWGMICSATLMCGVIALSRHVGLLSQDPLLPSCDPLLLAKAPGLQLKMKAFPVAIKAMSVSLSTNSTHTPQQQRASADLVIDQTVGMLRSSHDAKRLMRCAGGAKSLGGIEAVQVDQLHRTLWRLYGREFPQLDSNHRFSFGALDIRLNLLSCSPVAAGARKLVPLERGSMRSAAGGTVRRKRSIAARGVSTVASETTVPVQPNADPLPRPQPATMPAT